MPLAVTTVFAAGTDRAIMKSATGIESPEAERIPGKGNEATNYSPKDYVWFGSESGTAPIKWRVLDASTTNTNKSGMFILSESMLANNLKFNDQGQDDSDDWQGSVAQEWCSLYATETNFNSVELDSIISATKADPQFWDDNNSTYYTWNPSALNNEKLFFLSRQEVEEYLSTHEGGDALKNSEDSSWWIRSGNNAYWNAEKNGNYSGVVNKDGATISALVDATASARPATNLNLSNVAFTSKATGGKTSTALVEITAYNGNEWKVTLYDSSRSAFTATATTKSGNTLMVSYTNAVTGVNEYISVIIADDKGDYTHYGRIAQPTSASGTVGIDLTGIDMTGKTLYVFNEQYNGGANDDTKLTDYTSALKAVATEQFTVTYNANGHGTAPTVVTAWGGSKITAPTAPTATGYIFGGWYREISCVNGWDFANDSVSTDITLYAKWNDCMHSYTDNCDGECNDCGFTRTAPHTPNSDDGSCLTAITCSVCGAETIAAETEHTYDNDHDTSCNVSGCTAGNREKIHTYGTEWKADKDSHWHECSCGDKADLAAHTPKTVNAKETSPSEKGYTGDTICEICGYEIAKGEDISVKVTPSEPNDGECDPTSPEAEPDDNEPTSPETRDNSNMVLWISLMFVSALGLVGVAVLVKKRKASR